MAEKSAYKSLQTGSDIRGIAVDGVVGEKVNLTPERVAQIGGAFAAFLQERTKKSPRDLRVTVGTDSRISAQDVKTAFCRGLSGAGIEALDCGLASTPAMFMSTVFEDKS